MTECTRYYAKSTIFIFCYMENKNENFHSKPKDVLLMPKIWFHIISALFTRNSLMLITIAELAKIHRRR